MISLMAVVSGVFAMFAEKTSKNHKIWQLLFLVNCIIIYHFVSLSLIRWPHNIIC
jgi:hypothetical protein